MTLPPCYSWSPVGQNLLVPYEAPQGRRVNALGGYLSHGPDAGTFRYAAYAGLPGGKGRKRRKPLSEVAASHGLTEAQTGPITGDRLAAFLWLLAGRPEDAPPDWKRARPLWVVLDNYSVHKGQPVREAVPGLEAAGIRLFYLPAYSPHLSAIEPVWHAIKHHEMPKRSHAGVADLLRAVEGALARKAEALRAKHAETKDSLGTTT